MWRKALIVSVVLLQAGAAAAQQAISGELIKLHDELRLTSDQEAAWRTYTLAIAPSPQMQARHRAAAELLPLEPTPRRIALLQANMAADQADFKRQGAAVVAFYDELTPDQQRTFDRETLPSPGPAQTAAPSAPPQR
ncbi:MAG: hypothetical protein JWQ97_512 [Phenylobacterium sp.]|nr:hypothetical protein [Phenylobacterium sp.]